MIPEDKNEKGIPPLNSKSDFTFGFNELDNLSSISNASIIINKIFDKMFRMMYSKYIDTKILPFAVTNFLEFPIAFASFHFLNHEVLEKDFFDNNRHKWNKHFEPVSGEKDSCSTKILKEEKRECSFLSDRGSKVFQKSSRISNNSSIINESLRETKEKLIKSPLTTRNPFPIKYGEDYLPQLDIEEEKVRNDFLILYEIRNKEKMEIEKKNDEKKKFEEEKKVFQQNLGIVEMTSTDDGHLLLVKKPSIDSFPITATNCKFNLDTASQLPEMREDSRIYHDHFRKTMESFISFECAKSSQDLTIQKGKKFNQSVSNFELMNPSTGVTIIERGITKKSEIEHLENINRASRKIFMKKIAENSFQFRDEDKHPPSPIEKTSKLISSNSIKTLKEEKWNKQYPKIKPLNLKFNNKIRIKNSKNINFLLQKDEGDTSLYNLVTNVFSPLTTNIRFNTLKFNTKTKIKSKFPPLNVQDKFNNAIGLSKAKNNNNNNSLPQIPINKLNSCVRRNILNEKFATNILSFKSNKLRKRKSMDLKE